MELPVDALHAEFEIIVKVEFASDRAFWIV
jgi:hypothetical protein